MRGTKTTSDNRLSSATRIVPGAVIFNAVLVFCCVGSLGSPQLRSFTGCVFAFWYVYGTNLHFNVSVYGLLPTRVVMVLGKTGFDRCLGCLSGRPRRVNRRKTARVSAVIKDPGRPRVEIASAEDIRSDEPPALRGWSPCEHPSIMLRHCARAQGWRRSWRTQASCLSVSVNATNNVACSH